MIKLRHQFGNLKMKEAFNKADDILATAAKCITDVINSTGQINVDFADVCTVMSNGGVAILGSASAEGENRAHDAIENALTSPLLNDNDIRGAKWILININSAEGEHEFTMDEVEVIQEYILTQAGEDTDVILGLGYDSTLGNKIGITLIATGFEHKDPFTRTTNTDTNTKLSDDKVVMQLEMPSLNHTAPAQPAVQPAFEFEDKRADEQPEIKEEIPVVEMKTEDPFMPILSEEKQVELPSKTTVEKEAEEPIFFEISSPADHTPLVQFETEFFATTQKKTVENNDVIPVTQINEEASNKSHLSSGGLPVKTRKYLCGGTGVL